jgi:hypothetical protein
MPLLPLYFGLPAYNISLNFLFHAYLNITCADKCVKRMNCLPNCPKCGAEVSEEMSFCPRCGAPLRVGQFPPPPPAGRREEKAEKYEKHEKEEKGEKWEKHEKHELLFLGPLVGGAILLILGILGYLEVSGLIVHGVSRAILLIILGVILLIGALYVIGTASKRHPKP